jgi:hypothetical protein
MQGMACSEIQKETMMNNDLSKRQRREAASSYRDEIQEQETQEQKMISALAFSIWQESGCPQGTAEEDWRRAEQQVRTSHEMEELRAA